MLQVPKGRDHMDYPTPMEGQEGTRGSSGQERGYRKACKKDVGTNQEERMVKVVETEMFI